MLNFSINTKKNLLAFSAGVDSTALFFLLLEHNIPFDIAIVDYNIREQSKQEIEYALSLAKQHNKNCYVKEVHLESTSNFEKKARDIRYTFFEKLITEHTYETLITAHQLDDKLEWFLMQLTKGAGLVELLGMQEWEQKENYSLYRPLLNSSKKELLAYLKKNHLKYFLDDSNSNERHTRNQFRAQYSSKLLEKYQEGIKNSFKYLQTDIEDLEIEFRPIIKEKEFELFKASASHNINLRIIDKSLKTRGILLSHAQRDEIIKQQNIVISHKIAVSITSENIWIAPYEKPTMDKIFKEECRVSKTPKNIRGYLYSIDYDIKSLTI